MRTRLPVSTSRRIQMKEITREIERLVAQSNITDGLCVLYCPHTTAGLTVNENADPDVTSDLERAFDEIVPDIHYAHGEGNSPSHLLTSLTRHSLQLIIEEGKLLLGRWQGIYLCEFDGPRQRELWVKLLRG